MITHRATGHSETPQVEVTAMNSRVLSLRGIRIDKIVELAEPWTWHGVSVGFDPLWTSMTLKLLEFYLTGQTRGEALIHTFVANEIQDMEVSKIIDIDAFKAIVRRDTCFALIRQLHRLCWFSGLKNWKTGYDNAAFPIVCDLETLAASDTSGYIPNLDEVRAMGPATCTCNAHLSGNSGNDNYVRHLLQISRAPITPHSNET